ncbi:MAG: hypothetical protein ACLF0G_12485 [Candidatus Brocadiia bacterium]
MRRSRKTALEWAAGLLVVGVAVLAWLYVRTADRAAARREAAQQRSHILDRLDALDGQLDRAGSRLDALQRGVGQLQEQGEAMAQRLDALEEAVERAARPPVRPEAHAAPQPPERPGELVVLFRDDFEEGIAGWMVPPMNPQITGTLSHARGEDVAKAGQGALKLAYTYAPDKVALAARGAIQGRELRRLELWVRSTRGTAQVFVGATEADLSTYGAAVPVAAEDGWQQLSVGLDEMELVAGSEDENGALDPEQLMAVSVGDAGGPAGKQGENALLVDEFAGLRALRPDEPRPGDF